MERLTSPRRLKEVITRYGFTFSKSLGQNFLIDQNIVQNIIKGAEVTGEDYVLEVGPGIGTLTEALAEVAKKVVAVEIDKTLIPVLSETLGPYDNADVVHGDILKTDIVGIINEKFGGHKPKVIANLPYYITTPIIMKFLEEKIPVTDLVVMIQKEVAERIYASPSTKAYGALSIAVQYYADPFMLMIVPKTVFFPAPNVDSAVLRLKVLDQPRFPVKDEKLFFRVVRAAFSQRRKTLLNTLSSGLSMDKATVSETLLSVDIDPIRRGETLSIEEFAKLADAIYAVVNQYAQ
jgi:16S rRNA (adenine1518-N6/adenine1519-N6)-dimethyltransferase